MRKLNINNARVVCDGRVRERMSIYCENGKIQKIEKSVPSDNLYDARGCYAVPGFIDLHFHGIMGHGTDTAEEIQKICGILPRFGVTGFLPTVVPGKTVSDDIRFLNDIAGLDHNGTIILAIMFEGHFLSRTGALSSLPDSADSSERLRKLKEAVLPLKSVFAVSPEYPGITALIKEMTSDGMPAFVTHTAASYEQTIAAIKAGATHATHFFNVFPYTGDKEPGVRSCGAVEAFYSMPSATVDFIFDGEHVEPAAVKMAIACKGIDKVSVITDSNVVAGMPPGEYTGLGGFPVIVDKQGGPARLAPGTHFPGGLAGSGLTMDQALRNVVNMLDIPLQEAIKLVSANPAAVLKLDNRKGHIKPGYDADIVLLSEDLTVQACIIDGEIKYIR